MYEDDDDDSNNIAQQLPKPARDHMRKLEKQNQELLDRLTKAEKAQHQATAKEVLVAQGANPSLAKYALSDLGDNVTADTVKGWLVENADVFGVKAAAPAVPATSEAPADNPDLSALEKMQTAEQSATPHATTGEAALVNRIKSVNSFSEDGRFDANKGIAEITAILAAEGLLSAE